MWQKKIIGLLVVCCSFLTACGGGSISVVVSGLPSQTNADITISHAGIADQHVTKTTTLLNQGVGAYTLIAHGVPGYSTDETPKNLTVTSKTETKVTVEYKAITTPDPVFGDFTNFESPQTSPIRLSPDGSRLFSVNTDLGRVSVFSLDDPQKPVRLAEIPVGIGPVSVWPRSNDEAWVVNHMSDTVSVVSVTKGVVIDTLIAGDEPCDLVMVGSNAYVSVARAKEIRVFDINSHALVKTIPLKGEYPRALTVSPDGTKIYVAFALSGNHTTIVPRNASKRPTQPAPVPGLPPIPGIGLIVDASDPNWSEDIKFTLLDHDVAEISTKTNELVRYFDKVGTVNFNLAVNPLNGDIFVANTDAKNMGANNSRTTLQSLRGKFVANRLTKIAAGTTGAVLPIDLNTDVDLNVLPNPAALSLALAQPTAISFDRSGTFMWVAALGTDRIAKVDADGKVLTRIEVAGATGSTVDSSHKRGPHGLALSASGEHLYVQNRISSTISIISTKDASVVGEIAVGAYDPTPSYIKEGRGYFYDAKLSGNGLSSCASCHIDGDTDNMAWELSDPEGSMVDVFDPVSGTMKSMHPMKGPMVTQPMAGLKGLAPYHWRGDIVDINATNHNFDALMGGQEIPAEDMQVLSDFIESITLAPNPNLLLDRSFAESINGKSPEKGLQSFQSVPSPVGDSVACSSCHSLPDEPFKLQITKPVGGNVDFKVPLLRHVYKKTGYQTSAGAESTMGFGQTGDGAVAHDLGNPVSAFLLSWDSGTAPAVGFSRTLSESNINSTTLNEDWLTLEARAAVGENGLVIHGEMDGHVVGFVYSTQDSRYNACAPGQAPLTHEEIFNKVQAGALLTILGTPPKEESCGMIGL